MTTPTARIKPTAQKPINGTLTGAGEEWGALARQRPPPRAGPHPSPERPRPVDACVLTDPTQM
jgi:hypothetical protein